MPTEGTVTSTGSTPAASALAELAEAAPTSGTRGEEDLLRALLPLTRTAEGREQIGTSGKALSHLLMVLKDPGAYQSDAGVLCVRLLRNLCVRDVGNQCRLADIDAHGRVIDCIERRLDRRSRTSALRRLDGGGSGSKLKMPFFGYAMEFLVNFVTGHAENAELVWERMFPNMFRQVLECENHAAAVAASALIHNCVHVLPDRITDIVKIWAGDDSLVQSILKPVEDGTEEQLMWSVLVLKRLVEAGLLSRAFHALGPPLCTIVSDRDTDFSPSQQVLLGVLDASLAKSAMRDVKDGALDVRLPESSLPFLCELLESTVLKGCSAFIRLALGIAGSVIVMCSESPRLNSVKETATKTGIETLRIVNKQKNSASPDIDVAGLRGAAVRAIALACDEYTAAQDTVRELEALPLVLNCLAYEDDVSRNPFLREWTVIAVRNLCCGNLANQQAIGEYELQTVKTDDEALKKMGMQAVVDATTGKVRLVPNGTQ